MHVTELNRGQISLVRKGPGANFHLRFWYSWETNLGKSSRSNLEEWRESFQPPRVKAWPEQECDRRSERWRDRSRETVCGATLPGMPLVILKKKVELFYCSPEVILSIHNSEFIPIKKKTQKKQKWKKKILRQKLKILSALDSDDRCFLSS